MSKPPLIRQDPLAGAPAPISAEVQAQIEARQRRRAEERKKRRPKGTYDLPLTLLEAVEEVAAAESIARSDVVALALSRFIADYRAGKIELEPLKVRARSLRHEWKIVLPGENE